jgi:integrase
MATLPNGARMATPDTLANSYGLSIETIEDATASGVDSALVAASRQRGKSLMRRKFQAGNVFQKGRSKSESWLPSEPAYGRYWKDIPREAKPKREIVVLGICRTRTIAERRCAEHLEKLGINSAQRFIEVTSTVTFKQQGEIWLKSLSARKRNPLEQTTIDTRRYALDKWIYSSIGDAYLAAVNNHAMKELVESMAASLSPASIRDYTNIVKAVVASAIDENGEEKFPRKWNEEYIDAPVVSNQRQPTSTCDGVTDIVLFATGQYRVLYALLAGCGPLRAGEALGLEIDKHMSSDSRTLRIVQKAKRGIIQPYLKTRNGTREVDLCTPLANMLREYVGDRRKGLLFRSSTGAQLLQSNTLSDSLHPVLDYLAHDRGGFNIFRRFRLTHLEKSACPETLKHFWSGHAPRHVSERYVKLAQDRDFRLMWAEKIGLGFELPGASVGQLGQLLQFRKAV